MKRAKSAEIALKRPDGVTAGDHVAVFAYVCVQFLGTRQRLAELEERVRQGRKRTNIALIFCPLLTSLP